MRSKKPRSKKRWKRTSTLGYLCDLCNDGFRHHGFELFETVRGNTYVARAICLQCVQRIKDLIADGFPSKLPKRRS